MVYLALMDTHSFAPRRGETFILILLLIFTPWAYSHADIYKYVDKAGVVNFTNTPSGKNYKKAMSESRKKVVRVAKRQGHSTDADYHHIVHSKSQKYGMNPSLIKAVINAESSWNPYAVSRKGAQGLMQLMPATAAAMGVSNPFNPEENIGGGVRYLKYLLQRFSGNLTLALAAYNAGPKAVDKFGTVPPFQETRQYVRRVLSMYNDKLSTGFSDSPPEPNVRRVLSMYNDKLSTGFSDSPPEPLYKVVFEDGTVLFTNTPFAYQNASRF